MRIWRLSYSLSRRGLDSLVKLSRVISLCLRDVHPRKAGKPKDRKAERRKAEKPGAEKPRSRIGLGQANLTKPRVRLPQTTGMSRSHAARHDTGRHGAARGGKNISCSLLIIFQSKLRVCLTPSRVICNCWRER